MAKTQKIQIARLTILSNHPVLDQVARDLAAGIDAAALPDRNVTVFIGAHRRFGRHYLRRGFKITLQTEHYFDADGLRMWRKEKRWRALKSTFFSHVLLDLSASNHPCYKGWPAFLRRRVQFGPYIFPCHQPAFQPGRGTGVLFYGEISERRRALLDSLPQGTAHVAPNGTFGEELQKLVAEADGVLNLHYAEGRYSEMPRLLSACLAGKAVMSDPLGPELEAGRDYLTLGQLPKAPEVRRVFDSFWQHFAAHHSFVKYLNNLAQLAPKR